MAVDLSIIARSPSTISKFIKTDLGKTLSDCELYAASEALRKAIIAKDYRSQLWSVITHLETAEVAAVSSAKSLTNKLFMLDFAHAHSKRNYILIIMALVYLELGEHDLCDDAVSKLNSKEFDSGFIHLVFIPSIVWGIPKMLLRPVYDEIFKGYDTQPWSTTYSLTHVINKISSQIRAVNTRTKPITVNA